MADKKAPTLDVVALSGVVVDSLQVSKGDVVDMIIGQCEDALNAKIKALNKEAESLAQLTPAEVSSMLTKNVRVDTYHLRRGGGVAQLYVNVDFPKTGPIATRFARAGKLMTESEALQQALNDLVHGKSAKRAILKKFLEAHPHGAAAVQQIEAFGNNLLKTLNERVTLQLGSGS